MKHIFYILACLFLCCGCEKIVPPDNQPQSISVSTTEITEETASFSVTVTPLGATKRVGILYGTTSTLEANTSEVFSNTPKESNTLTISSLAAETSYYYKVLLIDGYNNRLLGEMNTFATKAKTVPETVSVTGVSLNTASLILEVNKTGQLTATVSPSNATNKNVNWNSNNTSIATVSDGLVTAKSVGKSTITVTTEDGSKTATCEVTVQTETPATVSVTSVSLNTTSLVLEENKTGQLTATVSPSNATNKNVNWNSSNTAVATVSNGLVTAKSAGTASITVTTEDGSKTATCEVTVQPESPTTVSVTSVSLNTTSLVLEENKTGQLTATVSPSNATNKNVNWSSSNTAVATVSTNGLVTAKSVGTATITVKTEDGNKTATCQVTVTQPNVPVTGVSLNQTSLSKVVGDAPFTLIATVTPSNATNKNVSWSTSKSSVATVSNGVVNFVGAGNATITVTTVDGGKTATCQVTVTQATVTTAQVRFQKAKDYLYVTEMAVTTVADVNTDLAAYYFGTTADISPYYEIPAGSHVIWYYYTEPDYENWYFCLDEPYTYNFQAGRKYTVLCSDDGEYLEFSVIDDGTFSKSGTTSSPLKSSKIRIPKSGFNTKNVKFRAEIKSK